ncbi:sulfatase-like hydrolase/transferase [Flagellimonas sp.]|uniref:sulfatase-like hydrolase/transferase n=1 Tax=Flagellimonas sp. TaxID=2058762 RepID=UPI003B5B08CD
MADDLGYETLEAYGGTSNKTPHLNELAKNGMLFKHCYSTPLCTPSRVQIMTGKYNFRNYIGFGLLDASEKTFGHYMKEVGYATFIAGKWQLLGNQHQQELAGGKKGTTPEKAGFDDYCLWQIDERGSRYKNPLLTDKNGSTEYPDRFGPDIFVERIESFMDQNKETPMFIYYPMVLTHDPFVPTPSNANFKEFDPKSKVNDTLYFGEMVSYMDKLVGQIVKKTEAIGIQNNTLILFVGDNGTDRDVTSHIGGTTLKGHKGYTTNAGTHVPLIAYWNGRIQKGSVNESLIDFTDFLPTMIEAATQKKLDPSLTDGISFYPQLFGNNDTAREWIFCHYDPNWGNFTPRRYVQNQKWKLYENGECYDLENDDLEKHPLDLAQIPDSIQPYIAEFKEILLRYKK